MTDHKKNQQSSGQGHKEHSKDDRDKDTKKQGMTSKNQEMPLKNQEMPDPDEEPVTEADPDLGKIQIDDDPEQTKKKIPQMKKQHG